VIRVLLADDHPVVRTGYKRLLEQAGDIEVVADVSDGEAAYAAFVAHRPDVVVTDLSMTPVGGLELIRRIVATPSGARVLVFSMHDGAVLVRRALESGARGFLTKASAPETLVVAVRAIHAGERYLGADVAAALQAKTGFEAERLKSLSAREFEILRLLAEGNTAAECADALGLSPKTVANHQTTIKEKLGVSTSVLLAHLALRHGLVTLVDGDAPGL
jgi:DNA-binding NarL/FixJ family response regulator